MVVMSLTSESLDTPAPRKNSSFGLMLLSRSEKSSRGNLVTIEANPREDEETPLAAPPGIVILRSGQRRACAGAIGEGGER